MGTIQSFLTLVLCGFIWLTIILILTLAEEVTIYDRNCQVKARIKGGTIYDRNWGVKGHMEDGKVYDRNWNLEKRIEGDVSSSIGSFVPAGGTKTWIGRQGKSH